MDTYCGTTEVNQNWPKPAGMYGHPEEPGLRQRRRTEGRRSHWKGWGFCGSRPSAVFCLLSASVFSALMFCSVPNGAHWSCPERLDWQTPVWWESARERTLLESSVSWIVWSFAAFRLSPGTPAPSAPRGSQYWCLPAPVESEMHWAVGRENSQRFLVFRE